MITFILQKELQNTQQSSQQKIQAKEKNLTALKQAMESLTVSFEIIFLCVSENAAALQYMCVCFQQNSEQVVMEDTETVFAELVRMVKERCSEVKEVQFL